MTSFQIHTHSNNSQMHRSKSRNIKEIDSGLTKFIHKNQQNMKALCKKQRWRFSWEDKGIEIQNLLPQKTPQKRWENSLMSPSKWNYLAEDLIWINLYFYFYFYFSFPLFSLSFHVWDSPGCKRGKRVRNEFHHYLPPWHFDPRPGRAREPELDTVRPRISNSAPSSDNGLHQD